MDLSDVNPANGPYWAAYQAERRRERITDDPDHTPDWFLGRTAMRRVAAARCSLSYANTDGVSPDYLKAVHEALRVVEQFIRTGHQLPTPVRGVVAGLLGADEWATERERAEYGLDSLLLPEVVPEAERCTVYNPAAARSCPWRATGLNAAGRKVCDDHARTQVVGDDQAECPHCGLTMTVGPGGGPGDVFPTHDRPQPQVGECGDGSGSPVGREDYR